MGKKLTKEELIEKLKESPYMKGYKSGREGSLNINPFEPLTYENLSWDNGFKTGRYIANQKMLEMD